MTILYRYYLVIYSVVAIGIFVTLVLVLIPHAHRNWANLVVTHAWMTLSYRGMPNDILQDRIPDSWRPAHWGAARGVHGLDQRIVHSGVNAAYLRKTNTKDYIVYEQAVVIPHRVSVMCSVFFQGSEAFLQIQGEGITGKTFSLLPKAAHWMTKEVTFSSSVERVVTFTIGLADTGELWIDDASCRTISTPSLDLLSNKSFEHDGLRTSPLQWWETIRNSTSVVSTTLVSARQIIEALPEHTPGRANRLNALDLLLGNTDRVVERGQRGQRGCLDDNNASMLIGIGPSFQQVGGKAAHEQLLRLAILLMPRCPQPYAALGELYSSVSAYASAGQLYNQAAQQALPGSQKGQYLFAEGILHMIGTGDMERAIDVLTQAEDSTGWEPSPWYYGAPALLLGEAYKQQRRCQEAQMAYRRVITCSICWQRHVEAKMGLDSLQGC